MNNAMITQSNAIISEELFSSFINFLDAKPKTVQTYTRALKQFFTWLSSKGINRPCREDIRAYREEITVSHKPSTVQAYIFTVRRFFEWTESEGLYPNIAGKIKGAKIDRSPKKDYFTESQIKQILGAMPKENIQHKRNYAIFVLMVSCGLRDIEVSRANIEDLRTMGNNTVLFVQGKGRDEKAEYVIVPGAVESVIRSYLAERGKAEKSEPLFISFSNNSKGKRMTTRSISGVCKEAMKNAGFDSSRLTAHSLRHTAVTLALIGNNGNIQEAQQFARHSNIATTQIYAHNLEKQANRCSNIVASAIF